MIKRTLYFGNNAYLHTKDEQLLIDFADKEKEQQKVPIEDVGVVILDAYQSTLSHKLISKLLDNNAALITCDSKHMPQGLMLNLDGNHIQQERFNIQLEASQPLKKQLWQQTIKAKIRNQANLLRQLCDDGDLDIAEYPFENMDYWIESVKSGDPDNYEGRAAAFYWRNIFVDIIGGFKRGRFEIEPNNLLNYGYAVLRAIVARSLVASGLLPTLGIHHHNKYNAYALADDIMEPYRPYVDRIVRNIVEKYYSESWHEEGFELSTEIKAELLQIPVVDVLIDDSRSPLMVAMQRTTASLFHCYAGNQRKLLYPVL
jgi:CRISP-associated protein Cas1